MAQLSDLIGFTVFHKPHILGCRLVNNLLEMRRQSFYLFAEILEVDLFG